MEKRTVRGYYEDGEVHLLEPVELDGCWNVEITILDEVEQDVHLEADPHRHEMSPVPERFEDIHRQIDEERQRTLGRAY